MEYIKTLPGRVAALIATAVVMAGCLNDKANDQEVGGAGKNEVTLNLAVPGMAALTRTGIDNMIDIVDVIVFDSSGGFMGNYTATEINRNAAQTSCQYYITGLELMGDFEVVAIANSPDIVAQAIEQAEDEGGETFTKEQFVKHLVIPEMIWGTWAIAPFPMYGETKWDGDFSQETQAVPVELIRAVACVEVQMFDTLYEMQAIRFFNLSDNGMIRPNYEYPLKPNLPSSLSRLEPFSMAGEGMGYTSGSVYILEAPAKESDSDDSSYIIISLYYNGNLKYYRIDMAWDGSIAGTVRGKYMPILRNYKYHVNINQVLGPGYSTLEEAQNHESEFNNLNYTIHMEDEGRFEKIAYDGRYMLGVGKTSFDLSADEHYRQILVSSNYPDNWSASSNNDWISLSLVYGEMETTSAQSVRSGNATGLLGVRISPNTTGSERTGTINITSGKLVIEVKVRQLATEGVSLKILDLSGNESGIAFLYDKNSSQYTKQGIFIKWTPVDAKLSVERFQVDYGGFVYADDSDNIDNYIGSTLTGGIAVFNIAPKVQAEIVEHHRVSHYRFSILNTNTEKVFPVSLEVPLPLEVPVR